MTPAPRGVRLLLVTPSYYPEAYGGAERQASILAEALGRLGASVTLLAPTFDPALAAQAQVMPWGRIRRLRVRDLPARGGRYLASTVAWTWKAARLVASARGEVDLVYVFHGRLHVAGPLLGARAAGLPVFVKPGGGGGNSDYRALRRKKYLYGHLVAALKTRWTTGFVAVSREVADDLRAAGVPPGRIHALPNGVALPSRDQVAAARRERTGRRFISVCRLAAEKNVDVLLHAVAALPQAELTIVGDGPELAPLQALADRLGLAGRVRFTGALTDVAAELIAHDAFLTASVSEGQSNALLEALAHGVVPIAANASGVGELVEDGRTGFLAEAPTPEAFTAAMRRLLALPPAAREAMGEAVYALAEARFGIDQVAARLLALFQAELAGRR